MSLAGRVTRLETRRKRRGLDLFGTRHYLDARSATKGPMPVLDVKTLAHLLGPTGALTGPDPACPEDADEIVSVFYALGPLMREIAEQAGILAEIPSDDDEDDEIPPTPPQPVPSPRLYATPIDTFYTIQIGDFDANPG